MDLLDFGATQAAVSPHVTADQSSLSAGLFPHPIKKADVADKPILCELLPLCTSKSRLPEKCCKPHAARARLLH
jgi:hypothetical protein